MRKDAPARKRVSCLRERGEVIDLDSGCGGDCDGVEAVSGPDMVRVSGR